MKGRVTAYAGYQLRDYFAWRAIPVLLATTAIAYAYAAARGLTLSAFDSAGGIDARDQLERAFEFVLAVFAFIAGAVAAHGLVARDRARGYDRLLLSRPLSPTRYYTQGFALGGLGGVAVAAAGAELYAVAVHPVSVAGVAGYVAIAWLLVGGVAFLLSTLTRFHTPILALVFGADLALDRYASGLRSAVGGNVFVDMLQYLLPPGHVVVALREPFARGLAIDPRVLIWPAGFGLVSVLAAMILLRRRPFRS